MGKIVDKNIKEFNTFGITAYAAEYVEYSSAEDVAEVIAACSLPWMVIGGGSNMLFTKNWNGLLLKSVNTSIEVMESSDESVLLRVGAGVVWDDLCAYACSRGMWGVENLSAIPGSVGAAPVQNVGAYGSEAADVVSSVRYFDTTLMQMVEIEGACCKFGYRDSIFKQELRGRAVIIDVDIRLSLIAQPKLGYGMVAQEVEELGGATIENIRKAIIGIRASKLPDPKVIGNGGSFFKNPVVGKLSFESLLVRYPSMPHYVLEGELYKIPAAWLIEKCGWKGRREGDAGVHLTQPLVLVNYGGASGVDILELSERIVDDVKENFGVVLEREINVI